MPKPSAAGSLRAWSGICSLQGIGPLAAAASRRHHTIRARASFFVGSAAERQEIHPRAMGQAGR